MQNRSHAGACKLARTVGKVVGREGANTEKDINTLLSSVLEHIKMGWSIKLNVAFWGGIDDLLFSFLEDMKRESNGSQEDACS